MTFQLMYVSDTNPNDVTGGGGCICSPVKQLDCTGPYTVYPGNDMENIASPHVVQGHKCACRAVELAQGEILAAGEHMSGERVNQELKLPAPVVAQADLEVLAAQADVDPKTNDQELDDIPEV